MVDPVVAGITGGIGFLATMATFYLGAWAQRQRCVRQGSRLGSIDRDLDMKFMRTERAYQLLLKQTEHQFEVSKRRLGEIHQLQAEVRALKL